MKILVLCLMISSIFSLNSNLRSLQVPSVVLPKSLKLECVGNAGVDLDLTRTKIIFRIQTSKNSTNDTLNDYNQIKNIVTANLIANGVNAANIESVYYSLEQNQNENSSRSNQNSSSSGFQILSLLSAFSDEKDSAGKLIDSVIKGGASFDKIVYDVSEETLKNAKLNLLKLALDDCNNQFKNMLQSNQTKFDFKNIDIVDFEIKDGNNSLDLLPRLVEQYASAIKRRVNVKIRAKAE